MELENLQNYAELCRILFRNLEHALLPLRGAADISKTPAAGHRRPPNNRKLRQKYVGAGKGGIMAFLGLRLGGSSSAGTVQSYSPHGCFGCGCGKGRNYGRFGTKFGAKSPNSSLLQGEQRQESGKKFRKILSQIDGNLVFFHPKWSQNGVWAPSGAKMGPGRQKRCPPPPVPTHFGGHF